MSHLTNPSNLVTQTGSLYQHVQNEWIIIVISHYLLQV